MISGELKAKVRRELHKAITICLECAKKTGSRLICYCVSDSSKHIPICRRVGATMRRTKKYDSNCFGRDGFIAGLDPRLEKRLIGIDRQLANFLVGSLFCVPV